MSPRMTIFGEVYKTDAEEIVEIAEQAAQKRGYVTYDDYNEYMEPRMKAIGASSARIGWVQRKLMTYIKEVLVVNRWIFREGDRRQTQFYPPGTDFSRGQLYCEPFRG